MFDTKPNVADAVAVLLVALIAVSLFFLPLFWQNTGSVLVVTTPQERFEYDLAEPAEYTVVSGGVTLRIRIEDGAAYVSYSTCPDGICVASGKISKSGETVICAPAGVSITVKGGGDDVDFVAG